jgi:hypothetical protein
MDPKQFQQICLDASKRLALKDTGALGAGFPTNVDGVDVEILYSETNPGGIHLVFEVGSPAPDRRLKAYEALLVLQTLWMSEMNALFTLDVAADRLLFVVNTPVAEAATGEPLAAVLKGFAAQVNEWRQTVLKGQLDDQWFTDGLEPPTVGASAKAHV